MKKKLLYALWGGMFILCAGLGFIPEPEGALQSVMTVVSLVFFLPPAVLLYDADRETDRHTAALIRNLSELSLGLTLLLLIANLLSVRSSETLGNSLHVLLVIVSSPMICSGFWALSLFFWACLLTVSRKILKQKKPE